MYITDAPMNGIGLPFGVGIIITHSLNLAFGW